MAKSNLIRPILYSKGDRVEHRTSAENQRNNDEVTSAIERGELTQDEEQ